MPNRKTRAGARLPAHALAFLALAFLALAPLAGPVRAGAGEGAGSEARRLTVRGHGSVSTAPDMALITLGVVREAREAGEAIAETSAAMRALLEVLNAAGLEARDVQTSGLSLSPIWSNRSSGNARPRITGFTARNTLRIRLRDLDSLGALLDRLVAAGANNLEGVSFGLQDPSTQRDEARRAAIADALHAAEVLAGAAGVGLGEILSISQGQTVSGGPVVMREMALGADAGVPIAAGEVTSRADVTVVFALK